MDSEIKKGAYWRAIICSRMFIHMTDTDAFFCISSAEAHSETRLTFWSY